MTRLPGQPLDTFLRPIACMCKIIGCASSWFTKAHQRMVESEKVEFVYHEPQLNIFTCIIIIHNMEPRHAKTKSFQTSTITELQTSCCFLKFSCQGKAGRATPRPTSRPQEVIHCLIWSIPQPKETHNLQQTDTYYTVITDYAAWLLGKLKL